MANEIEKRRRPAVTVVLALAGLAGLIRLIIKVASSGEIQEN